MAKRVLVVGGAGYIGSHIAKALARRGDLPIVFDNLSAGHAHAVKWGPLVQGDIRDGAALDAAFAEHKPDAVMHFAACIEVGEGERDPERFYDVNVGGALSLLGAMRRAQVNAIVFSSTCATYGPPQTLPITENEPQTPASVYGRTKLAIEWALSDFARAYGLTFAALRYFNAAGADAEGEIGEEHDPETHLVPNALKAAAGLGGSMKLFGVDYPTRDGTCVRDYIHVEDLAVAHLAALDRLLLKPEPIIANLGTGSGATVLEVIKAVEQVTGRKVPYEVSPRRPGDVAELLADTSRAEDLLGFTVKHSDISHIVRTAWAFHEPRWAVAGASDAQSTA